MARLIYSSHALTDLERLTDFLLENEPRHAAATIGLIEEAVTILTRHPFVGRIVELGFRELVISRGRSGYVALYDYDSMIDTVFILSVRHQREAGYPASDAE